MLKSSLPHDSGPVCEEPSPKLFGSVQNRASYSQFELAQPRNPTEPVPQTLAHVAPLRLSLSQSSSMMKPAPCTQSSTQGVSDLRKGLL